MLKSIAMAALGLATVTGSVLATTSTADAQRWRHHRHHHHHGAWVAPAIVGGLALGALAAQPRCWTEERIVVDRRGRERIRPIRVCR